VKLTSAQLVYLAGLLQAVLIAVGAYLALPGDPTGRPLYIAVAGVAVSAVTSYVAAHQVRASTAREVDRAVRMARLDP
jgi:mannose/fructose/N-acetylgalactosamine-specific phosphotransferase system component IID